MAIRAIILIPLLALAGCGQKGPLYFAEPESDDATQQQQPRNPASDDEDREQE